MNNISPWVWLALFAALAGLTIAVGNLIRARRQFNAEMETIIARRDEERRKYSGKNDRRKSVAPFWHVPREPEPATFRRFYRDDNGALCREAKPGDATDEQVARAHQPSPSYGHPSCSPLPRSRHLADDTQ